jgi:hypothetical protein
LPTLTLFAAASHTFASFALQTGRADGVIAQIAGQIAGNGEREILAMIEGFAMITALSLLGQVDALCGTFATALHNAEWQVYGTLGALLALGVLFFPPRNDPDQI